MRVASLIQTILIDESKSAAIYLDMCEFAYQWV